MRKMLIMKLKIIGTIVAIIELTMMLFITKNVYKGSSIFMPHRFYYFSFVKNNGDKKYIMINVLSIFYYKIKGGGISLYESEDRYSYTERV